MTSDSRSKLVFLCRILIVFGILMKFYGLNDPWKRNDHYNYGGVWTTTFAECLKTTPLSISKGIPHTHCWTEEVHYYRNHPPTILFAMWGWTKIFGSSEAAYRSFILLFSVLNIFLLFHIARLARPQSEIFPWLAATMQSIFLGGMYFGTHLDFIGEFTVTFVLLSAWLALKSQITLAALVSLIAGITAWPGYVSFAPLWLFTLLIGRGRKRVFFFGVLGFALALFTLMWLHQKSDIVDFLRTKLLDPGYVTKQEKGWAEPLLFLKNIVTSWARLLSPLLASLAAFELIRGDGKLFLTDWRSRWTNLTSFHFAVLLAGGTGLIYALIGHEYFMVHVFLYLLMTPGLALLAARFFEKWLLNDGTVTTKSERITLTVLAVLFAALYPYGIYQSSLPHDVINSILLVGTTLAFIWLLWQSKRSSRPLLGLLTVCAIANASQTMNYRNEPDTERSFCEEARAEYERTGKVVKTSAEWSTTKEYMYCRGIPIEYGGKKAE